MKTAEELNALKEKVETLNKKLADLTAEELTQISGGMYSLMRCRCGYAMFETIRRMPDNPEITYRVLACINPSCNFEIRL